MFKLKLIYYFQFFLSFLLVLYEKCFILNKLMIKFLNDCSRHTGINSKSFKFV